MKIDWPRPLPSYLDPVPQDLPTGGLVHHSLWSTCGDAHKVCIGEDLPARDVVRLANSPQCQSVVQHNPDWFACDLKVALRLRQQPAAYFAAAGEQLLGGIERRWVWEFRHRREKHALKDRIMAVAFGTEAMRESLGQVFEELFMNAVIDAPREALALRGTDEVPGPSAMSLTYRGNRVCLSCRDPYGTLRIPKFLGRMDQVYAEGAGQVINLHSERGGAGLGCVLLFEHSSVLALGVEPGHATVVSCVIPTGLNHRQKDSVRKSLHWIEQGATAVPGAQDE